MHSKHFTHRAIFYYLTVTVCQGQTPIVVGSSLKLDSQGWDPIRGLSELISSPAIAHGIVGTVEFLEGSWTCLSTSQLTFGQRPLSVLCHVGLSISLQTVQVEKAINSLLGRRNRHLT